MTRSSRLCRLPSTGGKTASMSYPRPGLLSCPVRRTCMEMAVRRCRWSSLGRVGIELAAVSARFRHHGKLGQAGWRYDRGDAGGGLELYEQRRDVPSPAWLPTAGRGSVFGRGAWDRAFPRRSTRNGRSSGARLGTPPGLPVAFEAAGRSTSVSTAWRRQPRAAPARVADDGAPPLSGNALRLTLPE